jgi:ferric-dicitrate binding protein FerR (iron transport regulator)
MWVLIQRYVTGNATLEERQKLLEWMENSQENERLVREIEEIWKMTPDEKFNVDAELAWKQFRARVNQKTSEKTDKQRQVFHKTYQKKSNGFVYAMRAAAVLLVIVLAGTFSYYLGNNSSSSDGIAERSEFYQMQEMVTSRGEKAKVRFSDGTEVILNSASSIKFPMEFQGSKREVYLDGEALFKVAHDPSQPFIVHARGAKIQVLGTEFNVKGWEEDGKTEVVVREGKVSVNSSEPELSDKSEVILTKGYMTELIRGEGPEPARKVDSNFYLLWTSGGMHFDNTPMQKVFKDIERRFDVNISVERKEILDVPFTSTFQYAELDEVLSVIAVSLSTDYARQEREVKFY